MRIIALLFATACADKGAGEVENEAGTGTPVWGNQIGQIATPYCGGDETVVALDEVVPTGFATQDFLDAHGTFEAPLYWINGEVTTVHGEITPLADPVWVQDQCEPHVYMPVNIRLDSDDGQLADDVDSGAWIRRVDFADTYAEVDGSMNLDVDAFPGIVVSEVRIYTAVRDWDGVLFGGAVEYYTATSESGGVSDVLGAW